MWSELQPRLLSDCSETLEPMINIKCIFSPMYVPCSSLHNLLSYMPLDIPLQQRYLITFSFSCSYACFDCLRTLFQTKGGALPQGATIVKLVTSQAGQGKPTAIITSQGTGQTPSNIIGLSSVQPQQARPAGVSHKD